MSDPRADAQDDSRPAAPPAERSEAPIPVPRFVAWVGRNSGWLIFLTLLAVALIEGLAIPMSGRR